MALAWDTTAVGLLARPGPARDLARDRLAGADPVGIPSPCLLELAFGYRRGLSRGNDNYAVALNWLESELQDQPLGTVLPLNEDAAIVAGQIRALCPDPPGRRRRDRSKAASRVSWILDIQIGAIAWAAGFDIATQNRNDFVAIADALAELAPGARLLAVLPAEA